MTLYRRILLGVLFISFCLMGLVFINSQLILVDSYQRLEEQNAAQNIDRVLHVLQSDIDSLRISDIDWLVKQPIARPTPITSAREFIPDTPLNRINLNAKLNVALLLDDTNTIVYKNAINPNTHKAVSFPQSLLTSMKSGNPLFASSDSQAAIKG